MNWKADQSQAGTMLDKSIKSSNILKRADWLGNIFIFESIGIASFIIFLFGSSILILKRKFSSHGKQSGILCFSFAGFLFSWEHYQRTGSFRSSIWISDHGLLKCDYRNSRFVDGIGCKHSLYFILEFNLRPSSIKAKLNTLNENTIGKVKSMMPDSDEDFEADEELKEELRKQKKKFLLMLQ
jgi:S-DNA-T family DNA segregation ATPase FtsK/SpoIIIE